MATENPHVWFKSISLENVRSFGTKQTINFTDKDGNAARWNVILGDNGTGKTTVLRGLVIYINDSILNSDYFKGFSRIENEDAYIYHSVEVQSNSTMNTQSHATTIVSRQKLENNLWINAVTVGINFKQGEVVKYPTLFAYGAARKISKSAITNEVSSSVISLFNDDANLTNVEEWLVQSDYLSYKDEKFKSRYRSARELIMKMLRNEITDVYTKIVNINGGEVPKVYLSTNYGDVRLHELSLGYKTLIAWMVDFAKGLLDRYPDSKDPLAEPAVCLVDEIDLHLHPKFQRTIIQFLTETFPNTQFIVTAHSPLIVQSAEDANIILLKREGNETHVADGIDVHSWRIDQILSSDLFGGISTRPPETESKMQRRRALLLKDERTEKEEHELAQLEEEFGMLTASESKEALQALELIGKALSK